MRFNTRLGQWWPGPSWPPSSSAPPTPSFARSSTPPPTPGSRSSGSCSAPCSCSAAPWTLLSNEHIRIDIVNSMLPKRARDWIDVFGHLFFLIPMALLLVVSGLALLLALADAERAVHQRRRAAGVSVQVADPARVHAAARAGHLGADQAHRHHQGRSARTRSPAADITRRPRRRPSVCLQAAKEEAEKRGPQTPPSDPPMIQHHEPDPPEHPRMAEFIAHNMAPIMFASLVVFLLLGYPVAFSLAACRPHLLHRRRRARAALARRDHAVTGRCCNRCPSASTAS